MASLLDRYDLVSRLVFVFQSIGSIFLKIPVFTTAVKRFVLGKSSSAASDLQHRHESLTASCHESSPSVTLVTGHSGPSRSGRSADIFTAHHSTAIFSKSHCKLSRIVTIRHACDGSSRSVPIRTIRRHFHHTP